MSYVSERRTSANDARWSNLEHLRTSKFANVDTLGTSKFANVDTLPTPHVHERRISNLRMSKVANVGTLRTWDVRARRSSQTSTLWQRANVKRCTSANVEAHMSSSERRTSANDARSQTSRFAHVQPRMSANIEVREHRDSGNVEVRERRHSAHAACPRTSNLKLARVEVCESRHARNAAHSEGRTSATFERCERRYSRTLLVSRPAPAQVSRQAGWNLGASAALNPKRK